MTPLQVFFISLTEHHNTLIVCLASWRKKKSFTFSLLQNAGWAELPTEGWALTVPGSGLLWSSQLTNKMKSICHTHTHTALHWSSRKQNNHFEVRSNEPQRSGSCAPKVNQCNLSSFCGVCRWRSVGVMDRVWLWERALSRIVELHLLHRPALSSTSTSLEEGKGSISTGDFDHPSEDRSVIFHDNWEIQQDFQ